MQAERLTLCDSWKINNSYEVCFVNKEGTRYFSAIRKCISWNDDKGNYMPFGGGSVWYVSYGKIQWDRMKQIMGKDFDYYWCKGSKFTKSQNGTIIPKTVNTKKEVMDLVKMIGIFNL